MTALSPFFSQRVFAHRGLHDCDEKRPENSIAAITAARAAGYGVEIDVQLSADGEAIVFHDYDLARLTDETGPIRQRSSEELKQVRLKGDDPAWPQYVPRLSEVISAGSSPLLIELKDQDGALGSNVGRLEEAVARTLHDDRLDLTEEEWSDIAVMSFNPHSVAAMKELAPEVPRGMTTCAFSEEDWPHIPAATRLRLAEIPDYDDVGACFISHQHTDLASRRVGNLKAEGAAVLCWTIRSEAEEIAARKVADTITFEAYKPRIPALNPSKG
ncbi:glycerophosphodiester phosphodiesterase family protein [Aestuariibius sp. 2305UL40-4]|uniref:glycerophosphodiester phosphodiesterase family protein n=1 Tax=Aestuariibius violaceus TaxID=3234132 RepID=UPI00345EAAA4